MSCINAWNTSFKFAVPFIQRRTSSSPQRKNCPLIKNHSLWKKPNDRKKPSSGRSPASMLAFHLLSYSPIGFKTFKRSGNLSGNQYLIFLIKTSMPKGSTIMSQRQWNVKTLSIEYKSTHLSNQSSSVGGRTQALVSVCNDKVPDTVLKLWL